MALHFSCPCRQVPLLARACRAHALFRPPCSWSQGSPPKRLHASKHRQHRAPYFLARAVVVSFNACFQFLRAQNRQAAGVVCQSINKRFWIAVQGCMMWPPVRLLTSERLIAPTHESFALKVPLWIALKLSLACRWSNAVQLEIKGADSA